jgi:hypothetical protein
MTSTPFDPELAKLIANLPQASSLDLYRIEVAVHKLCREPQRIVQIRRHLHLGMTVHFFNGHDARMHTGRIVAMRDRDLTIDDANEHARWTAVPYAAIDLQAGANDLPEVEILDTLRAAPGRRRPTREDFKVGDTASFVDRHQQTRIGKIVRLNLKTATLECDNGEWRVSYGLLQHVVDL